MFWQLASTWVVFYVRTATLESGVELSTSRPDIEYLVLLAFGSVNDVRICCRTDGNIGASTSFWVADQPHVFMLESIIDFVFVWAVCKFLFSPVICSYNSVAVVFCSSVRNNWWLRKYLLEGGVAPCNSLILVVEYI